MSLLDQLNKMVAKPGPQPPLQPGTPSSPQPGTPSYLDGLAQSKDAISQEISARFMELGQAYYGSHADDHETEFEAQLTVIRENYAKIAKCEQEAEEIAARKRCPSCGAQLVEGSMFCNFCGVRLPEFSVSADQGGPSVCPRCQAAIHPGDMFCVECGADLRNVTS